MVMVLAIWFLSTFSIFVMLPVAMLVYVGVATLLGTIAREDMRALYSAVRNKAQRTVTVSTTDEMQIDLQTTLEMLAISSGSLPAIPAYQAFVDTQTTLKQVADSNTHHLEERDEEAEIAQKIPCAGRISLSAGGTG